MDNSGFNQGFDQQNFGQPDFGQQEFNNGNAPSYAVEDEQAGKGKAIASMVCGICSIVLCCCMPVGLAGLLLGILSRKDGNKSAMSLVGIILSSIAVLIWLLNLIHIFIKYGSYANYVAYVQEQVREILARS